jgi:hypothetical protein
LATRPPANPEDEKFFISVARGAYQVEIFAIDWHNAPDWYVPVGQPVPEAAPADIVLRLHPRPPEATFAAPEAEPRILSRSATDWLFPDLPRRLGPVPGMLFNTKVVCRRDDLVLKPCGPMYYRPILKDMAGLSQGDKITVEVDSVDHVAKEFAAINKGPTTAP